MINEAEPVITKKILEKEDESMEVGYLAESAAYLELRHYVGEAMTKVP